MSSPLSSLSALCRTYLDGIRIVLGIALVVLVRSAISQLKRGLGDLTKTAKAMPSTIRISSRYVQHNADSDNGGSSYDVKGEG